MLGAWCLAWLTPDLDLVPCGLWLLVVSLDRCTELGSWASSFLSCAAFLAFWRPCWPGFWVTSAYVMVRTASSLAKVTAFGGGIAGVGVDSTRRSVAEVSGGTGAVGTHGAVAGAGGMAAVAGPMVTVSVAVAVPEKILASCSRAAWLLLTNGESGDAEDGLLMA